MENQSTNTTIAEGKTAAIVAYIGIIGLIIAFVMNNDKKNPFANFHIRQSLGLMLTSIAIAIVSVIPFLGWLVLLVGGLLLLYMWIMGLVNAINGKEVPLPLLGDKYAEWFKNV